MKATLRKLFFVFAVSTLCSTGKAQSYFVSSIPYNPVSFDSGIVVVSPTDDLWGDVLGIGFDFYFFGQPKQSVLAGTNSILSFDMAEANQYCAWNLSNAGTIPGVDVYRNSIMFPYQDVDVSLGGTVRHQVYGSPPNRKFVVSFKDVPYFNSDLPSAGCYHTLPFTGQVILYEGSNNIEMHILRKDTCTDWNNGYAIMGIQNDTATEAYVVPGRNNTVWTASNEAWLFSPTFQTPQNSNRISGQVITDLDKDCTYSTGDNALRNKPVIFHNDGTNTDSYIYTDMLGYYSKNVDTGTYTFTTSNIANQFYSSNCPSSGSYTVTFPTYGDSSDNNMFADTILQLCAAITPGLMFGGDDVSFWSALVGCDTAYVYMAVTNNGVVSDSVKLFLTMNDSTQIINSPVPYTVTGVNEYLFDLGVLNPGENSQFTLMVSIGCDTIGTNYCYSLHTQTTFPTNCLSYNSQTSLCRFLGVPYDPNAIYVSSTKHSSIGATYYLETENDDDFTYTVTFQNTGTAVAHNVKLEIPLNAKIDEQTIAPSIASAAYSWLVLNDKLIVDFTGINLPDSGANEAASHGFFKFQIRQKAGNTPGDIISHQAGIYFDYNSPILTNNAVIEIVDSTAVTSIAEAEELSALLFPNPASHTVTVFAAQVSEIKVNSIDGKLVHSIKPVNERTTLDISAWASGIYFVSLRSTKGLRTIKLVKQ